MSHIEVEKGIKIYVEDVNPCGAKTIVLIHGWPVNHKMFEYQLNVLPKYGFRCIGVDLRGFGKSDRPWDGYTYNRFADDIYCIIKELKLKDIILAGFSVGGAIAIRYMARHFGNKVSKLALIAAAAPSFTQRKDFPYGITKEQVNHLIMQTYRDRPQMLTNFGSMFFASRVSPSSMNWFHDLGLEAAGYSTINTAIALRDEDLRPDLKSIKVPTGIFHGVLDRVCPFDLAIQMNKGIKGSKLYPFEYSGHGIFYDELDKFNNLFLQFLGK